jgi:hypothetical protein
MLRVRVIVVLFVVATGLALHGAAPQGSREQPPVPTDSPSGRDVYKSSCAPCHGYDGKGSGPIAGTLKTRPPDLTELATRNGGAFATDRIEAFLEKEADHSASHHGTEEMQVRGPTFRSLDPADADVKTRIGHVVEYLATMQTEITMVAGTLGHHAQTAALFHIGDVWMRVAPNAEFSRWLSQGVDRHAAIIIAANPERFGDVKGMRILTGTLIHDTQPNTSPPVHELFLKDLMTGAFSAVTFETTNPSIAKTFDFFDNPEVSLIIQIT